jgi:predicted metal-binding protein
MRPSLTAPRLHLFVCANRREPGSSLGPGCGEHGEALYDELKRGVARAGAHTSIWVTKTHCLGVCPKVGATVAVYPAGRILADVEVADADALLAL